MKKPIRVACFWGLATFYRGRFSSNDPAGWISCSNGVGMVLKGQRFVALIVARLAGLCL